MPFLRFLVALASAALVVSGWTLQNGPHNLYFDPCLYLQQLSIACPTWAARQPVPDFMPYVLYALAILGALFVAAPLVRGALDQPPESMLANFIQRGRDLHERCRREGDEAVMPAIDAWTRDVSQFLRHLGHKYVVAFGDFRGVELFASQYDTSATLEIRQRLQRLAEFQQRFQNDRSAAG
jgi:hypothetical protein